MKSRRCSYRKRCSGFCSCPDSNWPPRYSYHGNVVISLPAVLSLPTPKFHFSFCPPSIHTVDQFTTIVQPLSGTVVQNKSPLSCHTLVMPNLAVCGFSMMFALASFLAKYGHSIFCGYFNTMLDLEGHTKVFFVA